jgi:LysM repeat protein
VLIDFIRQKKFMKQLIFLFLIALVTGCNALSQPTVIPSPPTAMCLNFVLVDNITCMVVDDTTVFLETNTDDAITIADGEFTISLRGVAQLQRLPDRFVINALEGSTIVSVAERTRVLSGRQTITLPIVDGVVQAPEDSAAPIADDDLTEIAIERTPRATTTESSEAESTSEATEDAETTADSEITTESDETEEPESDAATPRPSATATRIINVRNNIDQDCELRREWDTTYTVVAGDVMEFIARDFGTTVQEMALANCLNNPGFLNVGQVLRVPNERPTLTPGVILFRADSTELSSGDCTVLRWDIYNVDEVYIDGEQTTATNVRRVCPEATTTYNLRVVYRDDSETTRDITITVNP